jgi:monoamine oxidase
MIVAHVVPEVTFVKQSNETGALTQDFDVAVVGGGVSGVYSAWRLRRAMADQLRGELAALAGARPDGRLRVALFEYSDRLGGRLFSLRLPGVDIPVELGGMRFLSSHKRVVGLVDHFRLAKEELLVSDPAGKHLFYLRGQHSIGADWKRLGFEPPYRLERGERARSPGDLLIEVALRHRRGVQQHPERYRNQGFWNLLLSELSDQAYRLIRDAGGYDTIVNNWNAAEAIPFLLADFAPDAKYYRLVEGFEALPLALAADFQAAGGDIFLRHRLHRLHRGSSGNGIRLVFDNGPVTGAVSGRRITGQEVACRARHVILAMPRRSVEMLHPDSFIFDSETFEQDIRAVLAQPGFKIFTAYRRPWWKAARDVIAGRSVTDLPLRQCYYWHTADATNGNANSVLMASYNDGSSVEFWAGLARQPERYQPPPHACPPGVPIPAGDDLRHSIAPAALVEEMQRQLRELHGLADLPEPEPQTAPFIAPYVAVFRDWSQDPFGGGWHFWKIGADSRQVMRRMQRPIPDAPLYVCGEAWSTQQGWVEGALETADAVLERQLLMSPIAERGMVVSSASL